MRRSVAFVLLLAGCGAPARLAGPQPSSATAQAGPGGESVLALPMRDEDGRTQTLSARLCRPPGPGPHPLAVINHGAPPTAGDAARMVPTSCASAPAQWFMARGYAVLFALRRGFGGSTGEAASSGPCAAPDYRDAGLREASDVAAIVADGLRLPGIDPGRTVVVGQSTGGWATLAYDATNHPPLAGVIIMAGGRGGRLGLAAGSTCHADRLVKAAGEFGATSRTPELWVYARNDHFFPPAIATAMHAAFTRAGGHARLVQPPAFGDDGHRLFYDAGGVAIWGPVFERYLEEGAEAPEAKE